MKIKLKYIVTIVFVMALASCNTNKNDSATIDTIDNVDEAVEYIEAQPEYMGEFAIGYNAEYSGDYKTAVFNYELAVDKYEYNENNEVMLSDIEGHLGDCYYILGEYNIAIKHYENAFNALESDSSEEYMDYFLVTEGLGDSYIAISEYDSAKNYYIKALEYYNMAVDKYGYNETYMLYKIAQTCLHLTQYDEASEYANQIVNYDKSLLQNESAYTEELINAYILLGQINSNQANYEEALTQFDNAMELTKASELIFEEARIHFIKADTYNLMGDEDSMNEELELSESMCDDMLKENQDASTVYLKLAIEMYRDELLEVE